MLTQNNLLALLSLSLFITTAAAIDPLQYFSTRATGISPASRILDINNFTEWVLYTLLVLFGYVSNYFITASIVEYINPAPKTTARVEAAKLQMRMGLVSLISVVSFSTFWIWKIEPLTPYYEYYLKREFGVKELLLNLVIYTLYSDTLYYWGHRMLHLPFFWKHVHSVHHQFVEPTAFAQDAVHWFEGLLQGPIAHWTASLVYPMHPVALAAFGFLTSLYALLAHDGRWLDFNGHHKHHWYKSCNYGLYWGLWDYICDTRYSYKKFPELYIPTWMRDSTDVKTEKQTELRRQEFQNEKLT